MDSSPQPTSPTPSKRSRAFSSSGRSDRSEKTHRSSGSGNKISLIETSEEKHRRSLQTKADPMLAMSEAQPNLVALEKSNLGSLRAMQHKDQYGNIISEPDLSNPTRPRFERPLDTIRSFEAAIYGQYASRPTSYAQPEGGDYSRRSSYYNQYPNGQNRQYNDRGYHGGRPNNYSRPNSYMDNGNGYYNGGGPSESYYPYNQNGGRRPRQQPRGHSEQPSYSSQPSGYSQNAYGQTGYFKSSDNVTVATPSGSGSTPDQWANSTDPSSINSSLDQFQQQQQQQQQQHEQAMADSYGFQGFGAGPNINDQTFVSNSAGKPPYGQAPPAPPAHDPNAGGPVGGPPNPQLVAGRRHLQRKSQQQSVSSDAGDNGTKRKSWFKRTFTKN
ncbi:uncharacterized protein DSM5745_03345 [Aspergillus mulundensis]|uniref:Uncharacterized protein n=1 Tax=Aspergillus mulundensis TaxID=1810919 RepID=A0A3D8SK72_9EURO|nr:Uncharacterized protein DSM5745_03345 [Aspergillus mulundensis]RDW86703.1 Uncharacterized protein DSM5745_03345 [Aspergillus mulundensis]